jgi:hypothetical protein
VLPRVRRDIYSRPTIAAAPGTHRIPCLLDGVHRWLTTITNMISVASGVESAADVLQLDVTQQTAQSPRCVPAAESPGLLIGAQNALLCYDPRSGLQRWSVPFDSPLVAAFPGGSAINMLPGRFLDCGVSPAANSLKLLQLHADVAPSGTSASAV